MRTRPDIRAIFAVWSLGSRGTAAWFDFCAGEPFTVQGGGGSAEYGGTALYISGEDVEGNEGNGIIQFNGTFSTITFTTPQYENYYAFTIGEDQTLTSQLPPGGGTVGAPEIDPASALSGLTLLLGGVAGVCGQGGPTQPARNIPHKFRPHEDTYITLSADVG
jgi:hypothetical protein